MLKAVTHCVQKDLTFRHLKVMLGVQLMLNVTKSKTYPNASQIAAMIGVAVGDFKKELNDLVEGRYLHEMHPTFGPLIHTYKLGSMGGILMRQTLSGGKLKPGGTLPD